METGTHHPESFGGTHSGATGEAKEKAKELGRTARDRALSTIDQQKGQLSSLLDRVADTMQEDRLGGYASEYARRGAEFLRGRSAGEILDSVRRGFRSRPGLVLSACFVAGLAFARVVKGSASDGRREEDPRHREPGFDGREGDPRYATSGYAEGSWAAPEPTPGEPLRGDEP